VLNYNIIASSGCFYDSFRNSRHFRNCGSKYNEFIGNLQKTELTVVCNTFEMMKKLSIETKLGIGGELINDKYKYYGMDYC
jgi:DeoR/GlpR family transcriptional regulator of sugar metabolism